MQPPRYREIESALRARIARLRPGRRLPSDADLCAEFGVKPWRRRFAPRCKAAALRADLEAGSLREALIAAGMVPTRGRSSIGAEAASLDDAVLLRVQPGEPMLVERRLILDQRNRPLERTESPYAATRCGLDVGFSVEDGGAATVARGR